jgi:2-phospho-L-lactate/phosphoenolpyruvate guanylyltransferase
MSAMARIAEAGWALVVPLKRLERAKTRLAVGGARRAQLALAMGSDAVAAALAVGAVGGLLVVTDDPVVEARAQSLGADVMATGGGLNEALALGALEAARRWPGLRVAALAADLPSLRPEELREALADAEAAGRSCVGDSARLGTTLLAAARGAALDPAFGEASLARHVASGATELTGGWPGLRLDVDTADDLAAAIRLGVGPHTAEALA